MIKCTTEEKSINIKLEGEEKEIFAEMCLLFYDLRKDYKDLYLSALKFARENVQEESEEDD
jgi:hypothetical protein